MSGTPINLLQCLGDNSENAKSAESRLSSTSTNCMRHDLMVIYSLGDIIDCEGDECHEMLLNLISKKTSSILEEHHDLVARLVAERRRFENWLQLEILNSLLHTEPDIEIERPFPGSKERCDFWLVEKSGKESWLELKLCVTNYCSSYTDSLSARPITNQISDIIRDVEKLKRIDQVNNRHVLAIVYPMPIDYSSHLSWAGHMARFNSAAKSIKEVFSIGLERNSKSTRLVGYVLSA